MMADAKETRINPAIGSTSDGYHTFDELYEHRFTLWMALCKQIASDPRYQYDRDVWRSRKHSDGTNYAGWFLLGIGDKPGEQMTYHVPDARWTACGFAKELEKAPEFDGHTSEDVLDRIARL